MYDLMQHRSNKRKKKSHWLGFEFNIFIEFLYFQIEDSPIPKYSYFIITYLVSWCFHFQLLSQLQSHFMLTKVLLES